MSKANKKNSLAIELYWIDYCYETLQGFCGITNEKEFNEGYFKVRKIIEEHLESKKGEGRDAKEII